MTALAAILAAPSGASLGLEVRGDLVRLGESNVAAMVARPPPGLAPDELEALRATRFEHRNCFLVDPDERQFDRIHVGASCPVTHLPRIAALLKPGGRAVLPCGPSQRVGGSGGARVISRPS